MRLQIQHETHYRYETAPSSVIEILRLTPCNTANQTVRDWRIDVTGDAPLRRVDDAFGNITHTFTLQNPGEELLITASGTVETETTNGVVSGTREPLPVGVFLRDTDLTHPAASLASLAAEARAESDGSALDRAHKLNALVHRRVTYVEGMTQVDTPALDALKAGKGVCQDLAHVLLTAARSDGLPARYVSGYQFAADKPRDDHRGHAWCEIHIDGLGWVGFDPSAGACITDAYVRVAVGLDHQSASPVRGAVYGGLGETLTVTVTMDPGNTHSQALSEQSQSQSMQ
ncbi:transglutaminase family protein [Acuticoccus mangrovi]|uniref:Transglutaminase family protein n=1 Tax=Acuticoccus mangrovi TaxID=2796142 RepID=A0A934MHC8_9HYPH|nr:transglutaminase family protein [Acuticoccus mangrovi]MBJ3777523.1 transglutaminase family protein [Acuticoccus mangrovi]